MIKVNLHPRRLILVEIKLYVKRIRYIRCYSSDRKATQLIAYIAQSSFAEQQLKIFCVFVDIVGKILEMSDDARIAIEEAAKILGIDLERLLLKTFELGIRIQNDRKSATDFIIASDLEGLKASIGK
ncbi:MAG: hypothetical protein ACHQ6U_11260 [Thermodesulfobacteriota bacterium]